MNYENPVKWSAWKGAHMNGVVGNDALVTYLSNQNNNINFYGLNPGIVLTDIIANFLGMYSIYLNISRKYI